MVAVSKVLENLSKVLQDMNPPEAFELDSLEVQDVGANGVRVKIVMHDPDNPTPKGEIIGMWHIHLSKEEREKKLTKAGRQPGFMKGAIDDKSVS